MHAANDTHPTIARRHVEMLRQAGTRKRLALGLEMGQEAVRLSRRELERIHPSMNDQQIGVLWVQLHYGDELANRLQSYLQRRATS